MKKDSLKKERQFYQGQLDIEGVRGLCLVLILQTDKSGLFVGSLRKRNKRNDDDNEDVFDMLDAKTGKQLLRTRNTIMRVSDWPVQLRG